MSATVESRTKPSGHDGLSSHRRDALELHQASIEDPSSWVELKSLSAEACGRLSRILAVQMVVRMLDNSKDDVLSPEDVDRQLAVAIQSLPIAIHKSMLA